MWRLTGGGACLQAKPMNMANLGIKGAHSYSTLSRTAAANSGKGCGPRARSHGQVHAKYVAAQLRCNFNFYQS